MSALETSPALAWLEIVAAQLGELRERVVFLGGASVDLLITSPGASPARPTKDVDVIVEIGTVVEYTRLSELLRARGFAEDTSEGAPICRWVVKGVTVDVMPTHGEILGFNSRWYPHAMRAPRSHTLPSGTVIQLVSAPHFIATKLDAFGDRGQGDFQVSHDLEDVVAVIDGREDLVSEISACEEPVKVYLQEQLGAMLDEPEFIDALPGYLPGDRASQERLPAVIRRIEQIAGRTSMNSMERE